jgi:regulator of sirC expression with transglutaminase-like and TPR domain
MKDVQRRAALAAAVRRGSRPGALARACLLVARGEYPHLDPTMPLEELARLSQRVHETIDRGVNPPWRALAEVLGRGEGYHGNAADYDNPENSYINRVLVLRHGLPILLSIVWVEVARGAGIPAVGIGLPGRFIVQIGRGKHARLVDPYAGGRTLTSAQAMEIAVQATGDPSLTPVEVLIPATPRATMLRVLTNLRNAYCKRGDTKRQLRIVSDQLALAPSDPHLLGLRGELRALSDDVSGGLEDLNQALARLPQGDAFSRIHESARLLARLSESMN